MKCELKYVGAVCLPGCIVFEITGSSEILNVLEREIGKKSDKFLKHTGTQIRDGSYMQSFLATFNMYAKDWSTLFARGESLTLFWG